MSGVRPGGGSFESILGVVIEKLVTLAEAKVFVKDYGSTSRIVDGLVYHSCRIQDSVQVNNRGGCYSIRINGSNQGCGANGRVKCHFHVCTDDSIPEPDVSEVFIHGWVLAYARVVMKGLSQWDGGLTLDGGRGTIRG